MLEQEIAALVRFIEPFRLKIYFKELPDGFSTPSAYFPTPEVNSMTHSVSTYSNAFALFMKVFGKNSSEAYTYALQIEKAILLRRGRIPLYDIEGNLTGKCFRIDKVGIKNIDTGVAQIALEWKTFTAYDDETYIKAAKFYYDGLAASKEWGGELMARDKLTRNQKSKVNEMQQFLLNPIVKHNQEIMQYGEPYVNLKNAIMMEKLGIIDFATLNEIADMLLVAEKIRIENKAIMNLRQALESNARNRGIDTDVLYELNGISGSEDNFLDTSELSIGMVVKDYKALCEILGESITTGAAKIKQMKKWERFFDYEKMKYGNGFIIMDIYSEPLADGEKRQKNYRNSLFVNELKVLILQEISKSDVNENGNIIYHTSYSRLIKRLNIINRFFFEETSKFFLANFNGLFTEKNIRWNYQIFRSIAFRKIKDSISYALSALRKDNMIHTEEYNVIGISYEKETGKIGYQYHKATDDEQAYIDSAKKYIAMSLGFRNSRDACFYRNKDYQERLQNYYKNHYGWDIVYYQIKIIANQTNLSKHINEYTALEEYQSVIDLIPEKINEYRLKYNNAMALALSKKC